MWEALDQCALDRIGGKVTVASCQNRVTVPQEPAYFRAGHPKCYTCLPQRILGRGAQGFGVTLVPSNERTYRRGREILAKPARMGGFGIFGD
jgi:hypothetical protein